MRAKWTIHTCIFAVAVLAISCGGGGGGGRQNGPVPCGPARNTAWAAEVYGLAYPLSFKYCPITIYADSQGFTSSAWIDVLYSVDDGLVGAVGNAQVWTTGLSSGNHKYSDQYFYFNDNSPDVVPPGQPHAGERPLRANIQPFTYYAHVVSGQIERDSFDIRYPTAATYANNGFADNRTAAAYAAVPVTRATSPGNIVGPVAARTGATGAFRIVPDWDTTGYKFQWYVDGAFSSGDTNATFSRLFSSPATYTIRNDQILAAGDVLTSTSTVKVYNASISGPSNVKPFVTCEWTASASAGTSPYTYGWTANSTTGSGQYFDYTNGVPSGGSFTVQLNVTDATGAQISVSKNVNVSSSAPTCNF